MARICQRCSHHNEDHAKFCLSCGAMLEVEDQTAGDPLIGKVLLGRYRPLSVLGEGGMGKVYLSEQKMGTATRKVAIKTLHPELSNDPQLVARFHRESETVIELRHPNTIQFYDFGELEDGTLIIVMEYIEGKPLAKVLEEEGGIDPGRADKIIIQICGSLHEAHQRGVVHRDLKPENILLTDQGGQSDFVKVLDFGIAKRDDAEDPNQAKLTKQGMVLGTPPYMSPEQFSGQTLDARSDVYSLGIMAYEMLTGRLPFEAATPWEWATKHLTAQPAPIASTPRGAALPPGKQAAVMRALAKNRDERQDSVLTFLQEFTGQQDTDSAWTMATSAGGGIVPKTGQSVARPPAPTPGPMQSHPGYGGVATPPPGYGSAPGVSHPGMHSAPGMSPAPGYGSQPGMASAPGMSPAPGMNTAPGYPSQPGISGPGQYGYSTGAQPATSGGGLGKLVVVGVIGFFVLVGGAAGLAWYVSQDDGGDTQATNDPPPDSNQGQGTNTAPVDPNNPPMVPTSPGDTPMQPLQPVDPTTQGGDETPTTQEEETPSTQQTDEETGDDEDDDDETQSTRRRRRRRGRRGPSPADEAEARRLVAVGLGAARRNDFAGATSALSQAQRRVGRNHRITRELQGELGRRGSNQVGMLLQRGNCPQAQALYRQLRGVGAGGGARRQFGGFCPAP